MMRPFVVTCVLFLCLYEALCLRSTGNATVHVSNCTDQALCLSGCQQFNLPADECIPNGPTGGSQILSCDATLDVCGDLSYFTDAECSNLWNTFGFVCRHCNLDNEDPNYNQFVCDSKNGEQFLNALGNCDSSCGSCTSNFNLSAGVCQRISVSKALGMLSKRGDGGGRRTSAEVLPSQEFVYAKYTGAVVCQVVRISNWASSGCAGPATKRIALPQYSCMNGVRGNCLW
jgi:hypothetical protein